jgi:Sulfotransferase family
MGNVLKRLLNRFIPSHIHDPFGLAIRMVRSRDSAAWFALEISLLGILLTPLDLLLQIPEKRYYKRAPTPKLPLIFVCGASRTGTTLLSQVLIKHLPVSYINNLTAIFPRSPIVANILFGWLMREKKIAYKSYYGKSAYLTGPNEAFYIWSRWMAEDQKRVRCFLIDSKKADMIKFFGAYEQAFRKPLVNKYNNLSICANLVANLLENCYFLCMTRDPVYLAQSLLLARAEIQGDIRISYGVEDPDKLDNHDSDYIENICEQVLYHERKVKEQQEIIGPDRFWIIPYEQFCEKPEELVQSVSEKILRQPIDIEKIRAALNPFEISQRIRLEPELFEKIEQMLTQLKRNDSLVVAATGTSNNANT